MTDFCKVCGNKNGNKYHYAREMQFGFREQFTYLECISCGCLQLLNIPKDLSKYYPNSYYSLQSDNKIKCFLRRRWAKYAYQGKDVLGWIISNIFFYNDAILSVKRLKTLKEANILDVGCGDGKLINDLWYLGFKNIKGIDPYIKDNILKPDSPPVYKAHLNELESNNKFDLIMLHHSYEHMENPLEIMQVANSLLKSTGHIILRIPISSSYAWKHYGVNWVGLDAPRHIYIHTPKSISIIASNSGLKIEKIIYESNDRQFWASEQFSKNIPLIDKDSFENNKILYLLSFKKIIEYKKKAKHLNSKEEGDIVCFYLTKK